jgi:hypothetical protein
MRQRRVVTLLSSIALISLAPGCATHTTDAAARLAGSDASHRTVPNELVGTWSGSFWPAGGADGGGGGGVAGDVTLEIKDDATYRLSSTRRGRGDAAGKTTSDSGVVVVNRGTVTLKSSSGQWITLSRQGDALYGMTSVRGSGLTIQIAVERPSGSFASPRPQNDQPTEGR